MSRINYMQSIRDFYGVPVYKGVKFRFQPLPSLVYFGEIISASHLKFYGRMSHALDDEEGYTDLKGIRMGPFHPTWQMRYWNPETGEYE